MLTLPRGFTEYIWPLGMLTLFGGFVNGSSSGPPSK